MNARDPSPAGHVQISLNLGHRFTRSLAQPPLAFVVIRAKALEISFMEADRKVAEVTLSRSAAPFSQVVVGLAVGPVVAHSQVVLAIREQGASLAFACGIKFALGDVARHARSAPAAHRFDFDYGAHNFPRYLLTRLICGCSVIPRRAISRYCGTGGSDLASSRESG